MISHFEQADKGSEFWTLRNLPVDPLKVRVFTAYWIEDRLKGVSGFESVELGEFLLDSGGVFQSLPSQGDPVGAKQITVSPPPQPGGALPEGDGQSGARAV